MHGWLDTTLEEKLNVGKESMWEDELKKKGRWGLFV